MKPPEEDQSIFNEPHLRPEGSVPDRSEDLAAYRLAREADSKRDTYQDGQSVYDEPDVFPGRAAETIDQDWSCSECGYNLRGLPTGHRCPECGHRELYRPAAKGAPSYQAWISGHIAATSIRKGWIIAVLVVICGGPWAVLAALLGSNPGGVAGSSMILLAVVFGPAMEEVMKIGAATLVVEVRPYLFRRIEQLQFATVGTALLFAAIENVLYLNVYIASPSTELILWRWTVCVAMHVGCTLIATRGLVAAWERAVNEYRPPNLAIGFRPLVAAIVLHGSYNAAAIMYEFIA